MSSMMAPDEGTKTTDRTVSEGCVPGARDSRWAFIRLVGGSFESKIVNTNDYLSASHEVFGFTLLITWVLTIIWFPDQIMKHPARPIIGSFNPCFGWDYAPASYIALTLCSINVYLTWRYAYFEIMRAKLMSPGGLSLAQSFASVAAGFLAFASNTWLLLWLIGPGADRPMDTDGPHMTHWVLHTGIFVTYGSASFLAVLGNFFEFSEGPDKDKLKYENKVFIVVYGVSISYLVIVYFYDLYMYEHGKPPALHPFFTQFADLFWMLCITSITTFSPVERPLKVTFEVLSDAEHKEAGASVGGRQALAGSVANRWFPSILRLVMEPIDTRIVVTNRYLSGSQEVFSFTLALTWAMTYLWFPDQILEHPARPIIGSFNPCFGWDYAPASYFALTFCSVNVYLTWRYSFFEIMRTRLQNPGGLTPTQRFASYMAILLAISSNIWLLLWLIGPGGDRPKDDDGPNMLHWTLHTGIFVFYMVAFYLATIGNYLEVAEGPDKANITYESRVYIIVYGCSVVYLVFVYFYDLYNYEVGEPPAIPGIFATIATVLWLLCVGFVTRFTPPERPLKVTLEVVGDEELKSLTA